MESYSEQWTLQNFAILSTVLKLPVHDCAHYNSRSMRRRRRKEKEERELEK